MAPKMREEAEVSEDQEDRRMNAYLAGLGSQSSDTEEEEEESSHHRRLRARA